MDSEVKDVPERKVQDDVSRQILLEEAQGAFAGLQKPLKIPDKLDFTERLTAPQQPVYGPVKDAGVDFSRSSQEEFQYRINNDSKYEKYVERESQKNTKNFKDTIVDKVIPGFGRIESSDQQWRFDYLDPGGCNTKAWVGLCFRVKH